MYIVLYSNLPPKQRHNITRLRPRGQTLTRGPECPNNKSRMLAAITCMSGPPVGPGHRMPQVLHMNKGGQNIIIQYST